MRTLTLDIETSPNLAYVWKLWKENIPLARLTDSGEVLCVSYKWHGKGRPQNLSAHRHGRAGMLQGVRDLLDQADAVVTYNGNSFDLPWLNGEFVREGILPPSPYQRIDLYRAVRRQFRFPSNKLEYVASELLGEGKVKHEGFELWTKCLAGDDAAWRRMIRYCNGDVALTERLYDHLLAWLPGHPNVGLYDASEMLACPRCGGSEIHRDGYYKSASRVYQRWQCAEGHWFRSTRCIAGTTASYQSVTS